MLYQALPALAWLLRSRQYAKGSSCFSSEVAHPDPNNDTHWASQRVAADAQAVTPSATGGLPSSDLTYRRMISPNGCNGYCETDPKSSARLGPEHVASGLTRIGGVSNPSRIVRRDFSQARTNFLEP